jgi:DNA-binding transcriptional ArsR family regulator
LFIFAKNIKKKEIMTKTSLLDPRKLENAASRLKSIAHPMRMAIVALLEEKGELNVTQIYETLGLDQAAASHHLTILRTRGILSARRAGKMTFYSIQTETISKILDCLSRCAD